MTELEVITSGDIYGDVEFDGVLDTEYYRKEDADRAISAWKAAYSNLLGVDIPRIERFWRDKDRRNKRKRCLAMAIYCHEKSLWWYSKGFGFEKYDKFWEKWENRWLAMAKSLEVVG